MEAGQKVHSWKEKKKRNVASKTPGMCGVLAAWAERRYSENGDRRLTGCHKLDQSATNKKRQQKVMSGASAKEREKGKKERTREDGAGGGRQETKYLTGLLNSI